jgi:hypothetical protein
VNIYWKPLFDRMCKEIGYLLGQHKDGIVVLSIKIIVARDNQPIAWTVAGQRVESGDKEKLLALL